MFQTNIKGITVIISFSEDLISTQFYSGTIPPRGRIHRDRPEGRSTIQLPSRS